MSTNCQFPIIQYKTGCSYNQWGISHGEEFRQPIKELALIRKELMLKKNPSISKKLNELALEQLEVSRQYSPYLAKEIEGIAEGANLNITDLVILNNYTDFRDLKLPDEGCTTLHVQNESNIISGQTWDMHRSAKNYMCMIQIPATEHHTSLLLLSLVGCVGLMGVNTHNCLIGVNNINTKNARIGLIWPILVRKALESKCLNEMRNTLLTAPVTSGHNYLISTDQGSANLEITPTVSEIVSQISTKEIGSIFHTNHCIGESIKEIEDKDSISSTTYNRYNLITQKVSSVVSLNDLKNLLSSHDEYPKSICSHFENGVQDPSFTCGGGVSDLKKGEHIFWRGCPSLDEDYIEYKFEVNGDHFKKI